MDGNELQKQMLLSKDPETMFFPSGEYATEYTMSECPCRGLPTTAPVLTSQIRVAIETKEMWLN